MTKEWTIKKYFLGDDNVKKQRNDGWTSEEDELLAETILCFILEGKTQLLAFEEVGKQLGRTAAACGFRWNATVRGRYKDKISWAKKNKKKRSSTSNTLPVTEKKSLSNFSVSEVIDPHNLVDHIRELYYRINELEKATNLNSKEMKLKILSLEIEKLILMRQDLEEQLVSCLRLSSPFKQD